MSEKNLNESIENATSEISEKEDSKNGVRLTLTNTLGGSVFKKKQGVSKTGNNYISFTLIVPNREGETVEKNGKKYKAKNQDVKDEFINCFVFDTKKTQEAFNAFKGVEDKDFVRVSAEANVKKGQITLIVNKMLHLTKASAKTKQIEIDSDKAKSNSKERN